jgi:hypothetical protein
MEIGILFFKKLSEVSGDATIMALENKTIPHGEEIASCFILLLLRVTTIGTTEVVSPFLFFGKLEKL